MSTNATQRDVTVARHVAASARAKTGLTALALSSALVVLDTEVTRLLGLLAERDATVQRVRDAAEEWIRDDEEYLNRVGQHLGGSVARMAELVLGGLDGSTHD